MKMFKTKFNYPKKNFVLFLIGFLIGVFPILSYSNSVPDSLSNALSRATHDSTKASAFLAIARFHQAQIQYESAFNAYNRALHYTKNLEGEKEQALVHYYLSRLFLEWEKYDTSIMYGQLAKTGAANAVDSARFDDIHYQLGRAYWKIGNISSAFQYYQIALDNAEVQHNTYMQGVINNGLGTLYWRIADYNTALSYYYKSLDIREKRKDLKGEMLVLINIGWILDEWGKHKEALSYYNNAKDLIEKIDYPLGEGYTYFSLGNSFKLQTSYDSAIHYYLLGIETYTAANLMSGIKECHKELASTYENQGNLDMAYRTYSDLLKGAIEVKNIHLQAESLYGIASVEYKSNNLTKAHQFIQQSLDLEQFDKALILKNRELFSKILEKKGNVLDALIQYKIARNLSDSIFNEKKRQQFSLMDAQFKSEKIVSENELLKKDLALKDMSLQHRGIAILASIVGSVFLIVFVFLLYIGNKKKSVLNQTLFNRNKEIENQKSKIAEQNSKLTLLNETKDQLLATMGHDIKSPLTSIYAMLRFVNDDLISLDEQKEMFGNLEIQVGNVTQMVDNLINWSKSQLNGFKAYPKEVDIAKLVDKQQQLFLPKLDEKKISIDLRPGDSPIAKVDIEQLRIVVRNLLSNAIKFTNVGGRIVVSSISETSKVGISIADNGVGMSTLEIDKLLHNKSTSMSKFGTNGEIGTGLGLMLSLSLIEDNGGKLAIQSELGKGSIFTVWLPKS